MQQDAVFQRDSTNDLSAGRYCDGQALPAELLHIWVDADSCPKAVRQLLLRAAARVNRKPDAEYLVPFHFVAAHNAQAPQAQAVRTKPHRQLFYHQVAPGPDSADQFILRHCRSNDIVITRDIVFAEQLCLQTPELLRVINDRGTEYTAENVAARRRQRDMALELRNDDLLPSSPNAANYSPKDLKQFAACFDRCLSQQMQRCMA